MLLGCPALVSTRYKLLGCLYPEMEDVRSADVVADVVVIHNEMLRHLTQYAPAKLLTTFKTLWRQGDFPEAWKDAVVIPILKPGKTGLDPLHYRPISLTSALCKLMEKMVNARLTWFLEVQGFILTCNVVLENTAAPLTTY